jgi:membrane-bound ClpP family serine protease
MAPPRAVGDSTEVREMPAGSSSERERQYEHIKEDAKRSGRYKGREEEVAARTVNKQRREAGETKSRTKSRSRS